MAVLQQCNRKRSEVAVHFPSNEKSRNDHASWKQFEGKIFCKPLKTPPNYLTYFIPGRKYLSAALYLCCPPSTNGRTTMPLRELIISCQTIIAPHWPPAQTNPTSPPAVRRVAHPRLGGTARRRCRGSLLPPANRRWATSPRRCRAVLKGRPRPPPRGSGSLTAAENICQPCRGVFSSACCSLNNCSLKYCNEPASCQASRSLAPAVLP